MNVKTLILAAMLSLPCLGDTVQDYASFIARFEGRRLSPYADSRGIPTVGVGHRVSSRVSAISPAQANNLLIADTVAAIAAAKRVCPDFSSKPREAKLVLVSIAFNVGATGITKFRGFLRAFNSNHFKQAARALQNSLWYRQTKTRAVDHVSRLKNL